jgi:hypothetical protein
MTTRFVRLVVRATKGKCSQSSLPSSRVRSVVINFLSVPAPRNLPRGVATETCACSRRRLWSARAQGGCRLGQRDHEEMGTGCWRAFPTVAWKSFPVDRIALDFGLAPAVSSPQPVSAQP